MNQKSKFKLHRLEDWVASHEKVLAPFLIFQIKYALCLLIFHLTALVLLGDTVVETWKSIVATVLFFVGCFTFRWLSTKDNF